ncbi:phenylalanine--tRNA ligase subunit beta [Niastella yeongjuensis]|uniref:Phenylalanine--tRNA ligase beta subunit n=1 Tax=Niastella yeongjuensis TaxID=354355 RepID=A0A1V9EM13_9BACT|nr:phenylalanine--tRNA ligase subunit beta [Niastella yeongjuensis]OQP47159.1 phenylalanine--tRNA ligase subunit beta [Niastella yeongjuensis]SEN72264.1 phenylalanyl-tRNA synthetase beta subunit [Niastella yeongjuensis]
MTISYNWLHDYLPVTIDPERLSKLLTSVGLEVESLERYESLKGGLQGLVIGEVLATEKHPNADKLTVTRVNIGSGDPLQIVCGAPNVAAGQKVVVATVGTTIYPKKGDPLTMKIAKIRGVESYGMICAEDEIGLSEDHAGIMVLPADVQVGIPAADYFKIYTDWIYEIGLTPNRMDAMSHRGVARDVCAYLSYHDNQDLKVKALATDNFKVANTSLPIAVTIENTNACQRYSGVSISGVTVKESPQWLQDKLRAIGQRPINNIVDITNFILHETGQPLHAFDADKIAGKKVLVKNLAEGTPFVTLDDKERKVNAEDLMICNGNSEPLCFAGVFGGAQSGVTASTQHVFLESAWFNPVDIRKTSFRHNLRTDAATRFEKNVDISNTVNVVKRAALLIKELGGGEISSEVVDVYPNPVQQPQVQLKYSFLRKLSGKSYPADAVKKILVSLGFDIIKDSAEDVVAAAPLSKPDIHLPADIVEEIMRIDGLDNVEIPKAITISPSVEPNRGKHIYREKTSDYLVGLGFNEIFTNSITNATYFDEAELSTAVKLLNNLSADHNIMRPSMLQTGLEAIAHNLNRKNNDLRFFEFGKTYSTQGPGKYSERERVCLYITGQVQDDAWKGKGTASDIFYLKGVVARILQLTGISKASFAPVPDENNLVNTLQVTINKDVIATLGQVTSQELKRFDLKQPVFYADLDFELMLKYISANSIKAKELPRQLPVRRDLAMVVPKSLPFADVENTVKKVKIDKLQSIQLFDIFESEKLGADKKSLAVSFTFLDEEKTPTDKDIDGMMNKIMNALETNLQAEIRK